MENIVRLAYISFCAFAGLACVQIAMGETTKTFPEIDRLAPEHVEQATFALG